MVENRVGGTGTIGTAVVAQAPADGWTLMFTSNTSHVVAPLVLKGLPYDPVRDFVAIAGLYHYPMLLIINPAIPARTTAEFVAWAKARPGGVNMAFADGSVHFIKSTVSPQSYSALATPGGGEVISSDSY